MRQPLLVFEQAVPAPYSSQLVPTQCWQVEMLHVEDEQLGGAVVTTQLEPQAGIGTVLPTLPAGTVAESVTGASQEANTKVSEATTHAQNFDIVVR